MKLTHLITSLAAFLPATLANELPPSVELTWMGPLSPGGPNVTLTGTAQSIYERVLELNPTYNATQYPEHAARMVKRTLAERNTTLAKRATIDCGWASYINFDANCHEGLNYLRALGGYCYTGPAPYCARASCSHSCGMFLCSSTNNGLWAYCPDIANDMEVINANCRVARYDSNGNQQGGISCNPNSGNQGGGCHLSHYESKGRLIFGAHFTYLHGAAC